MQQKWRQIIVEKSDASKSKLVFLLFVIVVVVFYACFGFVVVELQTSTGSGKEREREGKKNLPAHHLPRWSDRKDEALIFCSPMSLLSGPQGTDP